MRCRELLCLLLGAALVSGAPSLLPGDPNYSGADHQHHHGDHAHDHGGHAHDHGDHAHDHGAHAHDHGAHAHDHGGHAHDGQAHPETHAHDGQAHPETHAHDGQAHPETHAHEGQAQSDAQDSFPAFPGQAFPGQAFPGQAFPGQAFPGQAFPGQVHPGQASADQTGATSELGSSLAKGIPDFPVSYSGGDSGKSPQATVGVAATPAVVPPPASGGQPSNPFLTGAIKAPSSSSFQVAVKPVPPPAQRPSPEPIKELNTNPLGGPAGPKGPVRASCPGPASALPCVRDDECDPYTGFLKSDGVKLPYPITKDTPTVAIGQCKLGNGVGVCCKKFPKPAPTVSTTTLPLGVNYGEGLEHLKKPSTEKPPNPFLPDYNPKY